MMWQTYVSNKVFDSCWIQFKFRCTSTAYAPSLSFNYVFGSEEYYEYVNSAYNDVFAFILNGVNIARLPTTETSTDVVSINNVNYVTNKKFFHGNDPGLDPKGYGEGMDPKNVTTKIWYPSVEADGFTDKLTAYGIPVNGWNTIKLAIADVGDNILDSWVLLESGTFTCVDITTAPSISSAPSDPPTHRPTTLHPTSKPTLKPTAQPTSQPSKNLTEKPTLAPLKEPIATPSSEPSKNPTSLLTPHPSSALSTSQPSTIPTSRPTSLSLNISSSQPSSQPIEGPSMNPTSKQTFQATENHTNEPSSQPSKHPTTEPSSELTWHSTTQQTQLTSQPSKNPTMPPTSHSSKQPTSYPSMQVTSQQPISQPFKQPMAEPSSQPFSISPTLSAQPTKALTMIPTLQLTSLPSQYPTTQPPTKAPIIKPTLSPTCQPSTELSTQLTSKPTASTSLPTQSVTISGFAWHDLNADGIQNMGEIRLEGAVFTLMTDDDQVVDVQITDSNGLYVFQGLIPGGYYSIIMPPSPDYLLSPIREDSQSVFDPFSYTSYVVNLLSGQSEDFANAGLFQVATISGRIWVDSIANGIQDISETGYDQPVTVNLYDSNGAKVKSTSTETDGSYRFDDVLPGAYDVEFLIGENILFTIQNASNDDSKDSDVDPLKSKAQVTLISGEVNTKIAAGVIVSASVGPNWVFIDINGNGIQDIGEFGYPGIVIDLFDEDGQIIATTTCDASGSYKFNDVIPGNYHIQVHLQDGFLFSPVVTGGNQITQVVDQPYGISPMVMLTVGTQENVWNVGLLQPFTIGSKVWEDMNGNGINDVDEPGVLGVTAILSKNGVEVSNSSTNVNGIYQFEGLIPGAYTVKIDTPAEYVITAPANISSDNLSSDESMKSVNVTSSVNPETGLSNTIFLTAGGTKPAFSAGLFIPVTISGSTWNDRNANGLREADEVGLTGVTYTLFDDHGAIVGSQVTGTDGIFSMKNLSPGIYYAVVSPPSSEFKLSYTSLVDSVFNPFTLQSSSIILHSGESGENLFNAGFVMMTSNEKKNSTGIGIWSFGPYYPDWTNDRQICVNDGYGPAWLQMQKVNYLYKDKELCCQQHFWWRITQCMQNEEFKFYKSGDLCTSKIDFEDWESNSPATWTETTLFDTLNECCANKFWYDFNNCMSSSHITFKFSFCVEIDGLAEPLDCQSADIVANIFEDSVNTGLVSTEVQKAFIDSNVTSIGHVTLTKVDGSTACGGSLKGQGFTNDKTGTIPAIVAAANNVETICGVITVKEEKCKEENCLRDQYKYLSTTLQQRVDNGELTRILHQCALSALPPIPEFQEITVVSGSFASYGLVLPNFISGNVSNKFYRGSSLKTCMTKATFLVSETVFDTLYQCCIKHFSWDVKSCCAEGSGCPEISIGGTGDNDMLRFFPTWTPGRLCDSKIPSEWDTWKYGTLDECCKSHFWGAERTACMNPSV